MRCTRSGTRPYRKRAATIRATVSTRFCASGGCVTLRSSALNNSTQSRHEARRRIDMPRRQRHQAEQSALPVKTKHRQELTVFQQRALAVSDFNAFERRHVIHHGEAGGTNAGVLRILVDEDRQRHGSMHGFVVR